MRANIKDLFNKNNKQLNSICLSFAKRIITVNSFFVLFFIILSVIVFLFPIKNLDELWNYNFARCIADGMTPYKDFSML